MEWTASFNSTSATGLVEMIDTFDRPFDADINLDVYAEAGTYKGKRVPKAGAYMRAGMGRAHVEEGIVRAEAKGPNINTGAEISVAGVKAFANAELYSASVSAGPFKAKAALSAKTGVGISPTHVEAKYLGTGFTIGRRMGFSLFGTEFEFDLF